MAKESEFIAEQPNSNQHNGTEVTSSGACPPAIPVKVSERRKPE
jgi:hypothetical protein